MVRTRRYAYSACSESDVVVEVDLERLCVQRLISTGSNPDGLAWAPTPADAAASWPTRDELREN
jgi:hypothetical protein